MRMSTEHSHTTSNVFTDQMSRTITHRIRISIVPRKNTALWPFVYALHSSQIRRPYSSIRRMRMEPSSHIGQSVGASLSTDAAVSSSPQAQIIWEVNSNIKCSINCVNSFTTSSDIIATTNEILFSISWLLSIFCLNLLVHFSLLYSHIC